MKEIAKRDYKKESMSDNQSGWYSYCSSLEKVEFEMPKSLNSNKIIQGFTLNLFVFSAIDGVMAPK